MSDIARQLLLQLILILLNAFFAATEIAVISLNEIKLRARAEDGDKKAVKMLKMIEEPTRFLSTIQIGITLAGFLGSAFAADNFAERLTGFIIKAFNMPASQYGTVNTASVIVITLVLSFFTLVLGELVPKRVAMKHKEKFAEAVCGSISGLAVALRPIVWLLTVSTNGVLRLFGIDPNEKEEAVSQEDIELMLDAGGDEGTFDSDEISYIKNVFKLDALTAENVMMPRENVVFVSADASQEEILSVIETERYSRLPVYSETTDNIVGILHTRDYLLNYAKDGFALKNILLEPTFVAEGMHLDVLLSNMQKTHTHIVIVVNEYGGTAGIVTIEDIIEELVGEIWDESDEAIEDIKKVGENTYKVLCSTEINAFFDYFSLEMPEDLDVLTVNGWLTEMLGNIPAQCQKIEYEGLSIAVTKASETMAEEITVTIKEGL
ncbi:MAG: HlyC/CorC family transporter [Clostridia bacterium]|nr:HlyC/CorC family transporter [Clostridia bacterium]